MSISKQYDVQSMVRKEKEWKLKPKESDYKEAKQLLKDFGVNIEIPKFDTMNELQRFVNDARDKAFDQ